MEPQSRTNQATPIPQVPMPTNALEVTSPGWAHRTPCERTFIAIFLEHILPLMKSSDGRAWQRYAVYPARTDDLVMTAIALLYSSHMNLSGVGGFAHIYQDHFERLLSLRQNTRFFDDDENNQTVVALLVVLLSQAAGPGSMFLEIERKLLWTLKHLAPKGETSTAKHRVIRQWVLAEIKLMEALFLGDRPGAAE